jgi:hypothetical protein
MPVGKVHIKPLEIRYGSSGSQNNGAKLSPPVSEASVGNLSYMDSLFCITLLLLDFQIREVIIESITVLKDLPNRSLD